MNTDAEAGAAAGGLVELTLLAGPELVEDVCDALLEIGALAASVEDADAQTDAEQALYGEPGMPAPQAGWRRSLVKALFPDASAATEAATLLLAQDWASDVHVQTIVPVPDADWVRLTQSQFDPVPITPDFWIVPSWHEVPSAATRVIRLDPGLAFGTGTHPTTRMCLRWLARHPSQVRAGRVLDYGCGSGILAIGAALFGATEVHAVDIDPAAVGATLANAQANGVTLHAGLPDTVAPARQAHEVVLANILASPLKLLAPLLCAHLAKNGHLVLAGILARQAQELTDAYAPWCRLNVDDEEDGWILMTAQRH